MAGKLIIDLFCITAVVVYVVDMSGFTDTWKGWLKLWLGVQVGSVRPFDCSLCASWWAGLVYLAIVGHFTLGGIALVAAFSFLSKPIAESFSLIRYLLETIIYKLNKLIDKLWQISEN